MRPAELVQRAAQAVRSTKYRDTGVVAGERRALPPSHLDRRYAVAACTSLLRDLAEMTGKYGPPSQKMLDALAVAVEKEEDSR